LGPSSLTLAAASATFRACGAVFWCFTPGCNRQGHRLDLHTTTA
jgi:hypothetical protein